ncbi:MAG: hypothetical protein HYZ74_09605 [Elusimicrobia bacterium]|nr:hypothetical protein [Elusimicrobiota bacterium]
MRTPRRFAAAILTMCLAAAKASALNVEMPRANVRATPGATGSPLFVPGGAAGLAPFMVPSMPSLAPSLVPRPAAPAPAVVSAAALSGARLSAPTPAQRVAAALNFLRSAAAHGDGRRSYDGGGQNAAAPEPVFIVNDEGVRINGRAAMYYTEVRRLVEKYRGKINLSERLDVMGDAYAYVLAKISAIEAVARGRGLSQENTHLEETLVWVDGVLDDGDKKVAVHTHRVFFHNGPPQSEIAEGIRRVDGYILETEALFTRDGKKLSRAEQQMGEVDEVELVFDARGYPEIREHLLRRGKEVAARSNGRIHFKILEDIAPMPKGQKEIREKLNVLAERYNGAGLSKIYEGVIYSRYVGLLLELKTVEHYYNLGYTILQSGRELFDENGMYVTELDGVAESPEGKVVLIEAKSARVGLPAGEVLQDKVVYKLVTYQKYRAKLEEMIGKPIDEVVFAMDVALDPNAEKFGKPSWRDQRRIELVQYLRANEGPLGRRFGFPLSFLFLQSGPEGAYAKNDASALQPNSPRPKRRRR